MSLKPFNSPDKGSAVLTVEEFREALNAVFGEIGAEQILFELGSHDFFEDTLINSEGQEISFSRLNGKVFHHDQSLRFRDQSDKETELTLTADLDSRGRRAIGRLSSHAFEGGTTELNADENLSLSLPTGNLLSAVKQLLGANSSLTLRGENPVLDSYQHINLCENEGIFLLNVEGCAPRLEAPAADSDIRLSWSCGLALDSNGVRSPGFENYKQGFQYDFLAVPRWIL